MDPLVGFWGINSSIACDGDLAELVTLLAVMAG